MKKKTLIITLALSLVLAGGGAATAVWLHANTPEQIMLRAHHALAAANGAAAVQLLGKESLQDNPEALMQLAAIYAEGKGGVPIDQQMAAAYYLKAAEFGVEAAKRELARRYDSGDGVEQNFAAAARFFLPYAEAGEEEAVRKLCSYYASGALSDDEQAFRWYLATAELGDAEFAYRVALCYENGRGIDASMPDAVKWYRIAADKGVQQAMKPLADCLYHGKGVEKNWTEAAVWYANILNEENADELYTLATCLRGVGRMDEALLLYEKAYKLGHKQSLEVVALHEFEMALKHRNFDKAVRLLLAAYEKGRADVASRLAYCYEYGLGIEQNSITAKEWRDKAVQDGSENAMYVELSPTQNLTLFQSYGPLSILPEFAELPTKHTVTESTGGDENEQSVSKLYRLKYDVLVQYENVLAPYEYQMQDLVNLVTSDFIVTMHCKSSSTYRGVIWDNRLDFWDARTLKYCFSCKTGKESGDWFDAWFQYDDEKESLYLFYGPGGTGGIYSDASWASTIDIANLIENDTCVTDCSFCYETPELLALIAKNKKLTHMNNLQPVPGIIRRWRSNDDMEYAEYNEISYLYDYEEIADIVNKGGVAKKTLDLKDIKYDELKVEKYVKASENDEASNNSITLDPSAIPGLRQEPYWNINEITTDWYLVARGSRDIGKEAFIYQPSRKLLLPAFYDSVMADKMGEGMIGCSDIGWYTVSYAGFWIVDTNTGNIYVQDEDMGGDKYTHATAGKFDIPDEIYPGDISVWNEIPGKPGFAYWVASNRHQVRVYEMDLNAKRGRLIKAWNFASDCDRPVVWMEANKWICIPVTESIWQIYKFDLERMEVIELMHLYTHGNNEFAMVLPDGRYAGTPGCERFLYTQIDGKRVDMATLSPWRNRPAEVLAAIGASDESIGVMNQTTRRWLSKLGYDIDDMPDEPEVQDLPEVKVARPRLMTTDAKTEFAVKIKAGSKKAVSKVEVRVDGVLVPQEWDSGLYVPKAGHVVLPVCVDLVKGQNWIEVTPVDSSGIKGNTERFRLICQCEMDEPTLYIVAMGVSEYAHEDLTLQYASKDARDVTEAFSMYYPGKTEVLLLQDAAVTDVTVMEKVRQFITAAKPQDKIVMYCAGHGMLDENLEYYFAPYSFNPNQIAKTGISMDCLLDTIEASPARTRLLLMDTCHSGAIGEEEEEKLALILDDLPSGVRAIQHRGMKLTEAPSVLTASQKKRYIEELFASSAVRRGVNVLAGASGAEFALESDKWKNGVFTASLIEVLQGNIASDLNYDGCLNVIELYDAVAASVSKHTGGIQRPSLSLLENGGQNIICKNLGYYICAGDWVGFKKQVADGYKLKDSLPDEKMSWLLIALHQGAPVDVIKDLLQCGCSLNRSVAPVELVYHWSYLYGDEKVNRSSKHVYDKKEALEIISILLENGEKTNLDKVLIDVCRREFADGSRELVELLLNHGANASAVYKPFSCDDAKTPLELCSHVEIAKLLIKHGADKDVTAALLNLSDWDHHSLISSKPRMLKSMVELYIQHGADVNATNKDGRTPLMLINNIEVAQLLLDQGASIDVVDKEGKTVLDSHYGDYKESLKKLISKMKGKKVVSKLTTHSGVKKYVDAIALLYSSYIRETDIYDLFANEVDFLDRGKLFPQAIYFYFISFCDYHREQYVRAVSAARRDNELEILYHMQFSCGAGVLDKEGYVLFKIKLNSHGKIVSIKQQWNTSILEHSKDMKVDTYKDYYANLHVGKTAEELTQSARQELKRYLYKPTKSAVQIRELGVDFAEGRNGRRIDEDTAVELYIRAAKMGDSKAQRWMGWRYRQGRGVYKSEDKALEYFRMAANQGDQAAAEAIGRTTSSSSSSGINTSGMSAYQIRELGVDYAEGRKGKPVNEQMAIRLYIQAADMGDMKAQRWMGWRYRQGRGVPKNESTARYYFQRAANQGDKAAAEALRM